MKPITVKALEGGGFELSWHSVYHRAIVRVRNTLATSALDVWEKENEFFRAMGWWNQTCGLCQKPIDPPHELKEHECT